MQSACVTVAPPHAVVSRAGLGTVAVVPAQYAPRANFVAFAKSKGAGAAKGAAVGAGSSLAAATIASAATGVVGPYALLVGGMAAIAGAVGGTVAGTLHGIPAEKAREIEAVIDDAVAKLDAQSELVRHFTVVATTEARFGVRSAGAFGPAHAGDLPDYAPLRAAGTDTVIELSVSEIGFESCGRDLMRAVLRPTCQGGSKDPLVRLYVLAQARVVNLADGAEILRREFGFASPSRTIERWAAFDATLLAGEFERAYRDLAEQAANDLLLATPVDLPAPPSFGRLPGSSDFGICWLAPIYPRAESVRLSEVPALAFKSHDVCPASALHFGTVDSRQPTLRWSAFPRDIDRERLDRTTLARIGAVSYDLRVWDVEGCERAAIVYERAGLAAREHRLETALAPAHRYFWSVRARFTFDGEPAATHWSFFNPATCYTPDVAGVFYHRFATPP